MAVALDHSEMLFSMDTLMTRSSSWHVQLHLLRLDFATAPAGPAVRFLDWGLSSPSRLIRMSEFLQVVLATVEEVMMLRLLGPKPVHISNPDSC